ncbi:MAG: hypothetical protein ACRCT8_15620 [Lacipirellulaceae bacterium]
MPSLQYFEDSDKSSTRHTTTTETSGSYSNDASTSKAESSWSRSSRSESGDARISWWDDHYSKSVENARGGSGRGSSGGMTWSTKDAVRIPNADDPFNYDKYRYKVESDGGGPSWTQAGTPSKPSAGGGVKPGTHSPEVVEIRRMPDVLAQHISGAASTDNPSNASNGLQEFGAARGQNLGNAAATLRTNLAWMLETGLTSLPGGTVYEGGNLVLGGQDASGTPIGSGWSALGTGVLVALGAAGDKIGDIFGFAGRAAGKATRPSNFADPVVVEALDKLSDIIPWGTLPRHGCEAVARQIQGAIGGTIMRITRPLNRAGQDSPLGTFNGTPTGWLWHEVVIKNGRVYDAINGRAGMKLEDYINAWENGGGLIWQEVTP